MANKIKQTILHINMTEQDKPALVRTPRVPTHCVSARANVSSKSHSGGDISAPWQAPVFLPWQIPHISNSLPLPVSWLLSASWFWFLLLLYWRASLHEHVSSPLGAPKACCSWGLSSPESISTITKSYTRALSSCLEVSDTSLRMKSRASVTRTVKRGQANDPSSSDALRACMRVCVHVRQCFLAQLLARSIHALPAMWAFHVHFKDKYMQTYSYMHIHILHTCASAKYTSMHINMNFASRCS